MAEALGFEAKVAGLVNYYRALEDMDPKNPEHGDVANPAFFYYAEGHSVSHPLQNVKRAVLFDMACHGRVEYGNRGFAGKDLREDTDELRAERADVLAVMTAPLETVVREQRAERIASILAGITSSGAMRITEYDRFQRLHKASQEVGIDVSRALFGVFTNGHISSRVLTIQYDTPVTFAPSEDVKPGERVMNINVPSLFRGNSSLLVEQIAA